MIIESVVIGAGMCFPLKGILTLPDKADGPLPAVVLVHGSGSSDMDERVGRLTPFKDLAEGLAAHGIAVLRYNKRSYSYGFRMLFDKKTTITAREETIEDAILAAELLRADSRIDPERIFVLGHSMGGMLAPRIDAEGGKFRGLILMAGSPRRLEEILIAQLEEMAAASRSLTRRIMESQTKKMRKTFDGLYAMSDEDAKKKKFGGGTTLYYFKEMGEHPASSYLEASDKPMLILQGGKDAQAKADTDFRLYREMLGDRENVTFRLYEELNHAFVPALSDSIAKARQEYAVERHIGEDVIGDIAAWIGGIDGGSNR